MVKLFGYFTRPKKERKKLKKERAAFEHERNSFNAQRPHMEREDEQERERQIIQNTQKNKEHRLAGQAEGEKHGLSTFNREDIHGLTPEQRRNAEYESEQEINRNLFANEKKLLGERGKRNIGNRSGVAFAQQQALKRDAQEARGKARRDLENLNSDLRLKKQAAVFAAGKGEAGQALLDRQAAADELDLRKQRKKYDEDERHLTNSFMTII